MGSLVGLAAQLSTKGFIPWFANVASNSMNGYSWITTLFLLVVIYMYSHYAFAFTANICLPITHYSGAPGPIYYGAGYIVLRTWWKIGFLFSIVNLAIWVGVGSI